MRKCCFSDILFLYCFPLLVNHVARIDYQILMTLCWNIVNTIIYHIHFFFFISNPNFFTNFNVCIAISLSYNFSLSGKLQ